MQIQIKKGGQEGFWGYDEDAGEQDDDDDPFNYNEP